MSSLIRSPRRRHIARAAHLFSIFIVNRKTTPLARLLSLILAFLLLTPPTVFSGRTAINGTIYSPAASRARTTGDTSNKQANASDTTIHDDTASPSTTPATVPPAQSTAQTPQLLSATQITKGAARPDELLARFKPDAKDPDISTLLQAKGITRKGLLRGAASASGIERLQLLPGSDVELMATALRTAPVVDFVEPNYLIAQDGVQAKDSPTKDFTIKNIFDRQTDKNLAPKTGELNAPGFYDRRSSSLTERYAGKSSGLAQEIAPSDPRFADQWGLHNTGNNGGTGKAALTGADINVMKAWSVTVGSEKTIIAVIDSGVDFTHPDLKNNEWTNKDEQPNGKDNDKDGFIADIHGWDFITDTADVKDESGHGTAIAGIIAAEGNNNTGISGVMWKASLMSLRVLDAKGTGDVASAVEASTLPSRTARASSTARGEPRVNPSRFIQPSLTRVSIT